MSSALATDHLIVVGLNHKTAPLHIREQLALQGESKAELIKTLKRRLSGGTMVVSTCNRVEFYGLSSTLSLGEEGLTDHQVLEMISDVVSERCQIPIDELIKHFYIHRGDEALHHIFRVASSLDSLVIGEPQILGQLKEALEESQSFETSGDLSILMERAFLVARRVRNQTGISKHVVSVSSIAVRLARHIFEDLSERTALLIGAGEMGELAARHLHQDGVGRLLVANRNLDRAVALAEKLNGSPRALSELSELLVTADIVITSTGSQEPIITPEIAQAALKSRKYRPLFIIDIAVPRDVDPRVNRLENIYVYDVDDLSQIADENMAQRANEATIAEELVKEELLKFHRERAQRNLGPLITALRTKVHTLKTQEIDWALSKEVVMNQAQEKLLRQMGDRLTNKILHDVLTGLKSLAHHPQSEDVIEVVSTLFKLTLPEEDLSPSSEDP